MAIPNFAVVRVGQVYRGGQPSEPEDWFTLSKIGIRTVLKLNYCDEGRDPIADQRFNWYISSIPPEDTFQTLQPVRETLLNFALDTLTDPDTYPLFVHCTHGQDRTGLLVGMYRVRTGWSDDRAWLEMLNHGFHWQLANLTAAWLEFLTKENL